MKNLLPAVGAGLYSGLLFAAANTGVSLAVVFLTLVLPLPMLMVGLGRGTQAALIAVTVGAAVVLLTQPDGALKFVLTYAAPTWLIVRLALTGPNGTITQAPDHTGPRTPEGPETQSTFAERITGRVKDWESEPDAPPRDAGWVPAGNIVAAMTAFAAVLTAAVAVWAGGLQAATTALLTDVFTAMVTAFQTPNGDEVVKEAVARAVPFFPGATVWSWEVTLLANAVMAQGLLAKGGRNLRPSPRLRELTLPDWLSWALVAAALVSLTLPGEIGYLGQNLTLVLSIPFFFLGLAVGHKVASLTPLPGALLALFYMAILTGWFALFIVALGVLEQWVGLKSRMTPPTER